MGFYRAGIAVLIGCLTVSCGGGGGSGGNSDNTNTSTISMAELGKKLFFDTNLSSGSNQSCGTC
ncbi:MAG: cytochrome c peroxidase, partial [Candidatus Thiodiazotropha endolucinida]